MGTLNNLRLIKRILASFWNLQKYKVRKNKKFKNIHKGETCFIFGNGASLKYYDFNVIPKDIPIITCGFGLFDKRLKSKNIQYNIFSDSYSTYPLVYNDYIDGIQKNPMFRIAKKMINENKSVHFFISLTNKFSFFKKPKNVSYWHHFGNKASSSYNLAGEFSTSSCALDMMIGVARYLGFSNAILFGCDYLCTPKMEGHFYTSTIPKFGKDNIEYVNRIAKNVGNLDILVICPKASSGINFQSKTFEEYFGVKEIYQTNKEIIGEKNMELFYEISDAKLIFL
jgi:hypothetical protein